MNKKSSISLSLLLEKKRVALFRAASFSVVSREQSMEQRGELGRQPPLRVPLKADIHHANAM
jgi:hypothetical protein